MSFKQPQSTQQCCNIPTQILCPKSDIKQGHKAIAGAGVRCVVLETRHPSHAKDIVAALPMHELELYNGILAVMPG